MDAKTDCAKQKPALNPFNLQTPRWPRARRIGTCIARARTPLCSSAYAQACGRMHKRRGY
eukprot:8725876-Pyramimonas_sp.AAC.1